jgi:hypothetical protein
MNFLGCGPKKNLRPKIRPSMEKSLILQKTLTYQLLS